MENWRSISRMCTGVVDAPQCLDDNLPTPSNVGRNNTAHSRFRSSTNEADFALDSQYSDSTSPSVGESFMPRSPCQSSRGGALQSVSTDEDDSTVPTAGRPNKSSENTSRHKNELEGLWYGPSSSASVSHTEAGENSISVLKDVIKPNAKFMSARFHDGHIKPVMPEATRRYTGKPSIDKETTTMIIEPLTIEFETPIPPLGWRRYTHVEGGRYFVHEKMRIYTDADLYDSRILRQTEEDLANIDNFITSNTGLIIPDNSDLVLDIFYDDSYDFLQTTYYYVNHSSRTIFFLDTFEAASLEAWHEVPGARTKQHLRHEIEAQYWYHIQLYPHCLSLTKSLICELRGIILHFVGDTLTSSTSVAPYSLDNLDRILGWMDKLERNVDCHDEGPISLLGRLMFVFARSRFLDFHGEAHSRLERNFSVYGTNPRRTWFIKIFSPLLFFSPDFYMKTLHDLYVDQIVNMNNWDAFREKLALDWRQYVLYGSILLNADVIFLVMPHEHDLHLSEARIVAYISVIATLGSIVTGLVQLRRQVTGSWIPAEVQGYLSRCIHPLLGLEPLSVAYSLPHALLIWGMISFLASILILCFERSSILTKSLVGSSSIFLISIIALVVSMNWDASPLSKHAYRGVESAGFQSKNPEKTLEESSRPRIKAANSYLRRTWVMQSFLKRHHRESSVQAGNRGLEV